MTSICVGLMSSISSVQHFQKQRFIFPFLLLGCSTLDHNRRSSRTSSLKKKHLQHKWWWIRQERDKRGVITGRDRQGGGRWETTKRKSAFQSRVENSGAWAALMRTLFLLTLKLQQWGSWWGNDASLITTSVVTITFSLSNVKPDIRLLYKWGMNVQEETSQQNSVRTAGCRDATVYLHMFSCVYEAINHTQL